MSAHQRRSTTAASPDKPSGTEPPVGTSIAPLIDRERLIADLRQFCAQASTSQASTSQQNHELAVTARLVTRLMQRAGLTSDLIKTPGAPILLGRCAGRSAFTLLLYHHYDLAPSGPWHDWAHEPFQLAEREGLLYGRGVAHGKGPLIAQLAALQALREQEGELPCNVVVVVEGEGLTGSPFLAEVFQQNAHILQADACLASSGERDLEGRPFCYRGSKGLLRVELHSSGPNVPLSPGMASIVRNPAWRMAWALTTIKGEDEEVRIVGFYDNVSGPSREENALLRQVRLAEPGRLASWGLRDFLFDMRGGALVQAEVTLPTCNLNYFRIDAANSVPDIPTATRARLDFQLVPHQSPDEVMTLLREHLIARSFEDVAVQRLPGGYAPVQTERGHPFLQWLREAGAACYGAPPVTLSLGPFTAPLRCFVDALAIPVASIGLARSDSSIYGPNERIRLHDLLDHARLTIEVLRRCAR
jgi:acetylornithine deacetylase/succinyl-diaminopimelate desuccinylase-like protein